MTSLATEQAGSPTTSARPKWLRPWRLWKLFFSALAVTLFAGFWQFWNEEFGADGDHSVAAAAHETSPGPTCGDAGALLACAVEAPLAAAGGDEVLVEADAGDGATGGATAVVVDPTEAIASSPATIVLKVDSPVRAKAAPDSAQPRKAKRGRETATLSSLSRPGPWAPSVLDSYNAMILGSELAARGLLGGQDGDGEGKTIDDLIRAIPAHLPAFGYVSSNYGWRRSPFSGRRVYHKGVDFAVPWGSPVYATADGVVIHAGWYRGLGKLVSVDHGHGIVTRYGHNSSFRSKVGDAVRRGDVIALAGSTGRSTGSHVHYEVWLNGRTIDPRQFMFDLPDSPAPRHPDDSEADAMLADGDESDHDDETGAVTADAESAVGGDESAPLAPAEARAMAPERVMPVNVAIICAFLAVVAMLLRSLVSDARHDGLVTGTSPSLAASPSSSPRR
jgi:murein DD-endopeptidase MepM/ murein hydrolase activator NlpD